jgi:PTS system mannose-specific IIC component
MALERRAFLQAMVSRPLVAATGMGLLLRDLPSGLYVGLLLELFHLGSATMGAALTDNDTLAATGTAAAAACMAHGTGSPSTPAMHAFAILLFMGLGPLGRVLDRSLEVYSSRLSRMALSSAESGDVERAVRQNLWGMWPYFAVFGLATAGCAGVGFLLAPLMDGLPAQVLRGLAWAYPAMASVAAAMAVRGSHAQRAPALAAAAAGLAVVGRSYLAWSHG